MPSFTRFGNDLYTGRRSIDFVGRRRRWYAVSAVLLAIAIIGLGLRGLNLGLEFTGGSEFRVSNAQVSSDYEATARDAVASQGDAQEAKVTKLGDDTVRVQTVKLDDRESEQVRAALADAFGVNESQVSATFIGPSWGASVSQQALRALVVFLILVALVMAVYFRTWKMSVAALVALAHDMVFTVGIYALSGFEVSPATMIGFLTVLGYSLYDTVVVFDKVRENTTLAFANRRSSYAGAANLAVNQTLVRSINTTVVALLPISAILFVGFTRLGPGTLLDLALALFIGMAVGAYSSIFIATPLLVSMRQREPEVVKLAKQAAKHRRRSAEGTEPTGRPGEAPAGPSEPEAAAEPEHVGVGAPAADGDTGTLTGRKVHKYAQSGPRNQPRRAPKSRR
jgi:preprotein translocase subunit SecF